MEEKIYLNKNYRAIACGSIDRVKKVHVEFLDKGRKRFYIRANEEAREICKNMGYLEGSDVSLPSENSRKQTTEKDTIRLVKEGAINPSEYFCKDHEDLHSRGEVNYYACIEKFLTDTWEIDEGKEEDVSRKADVVSLDSKAAGVDTAENEDTTETVVSPLTPDPDDRTHTLNASQSRRLIGQTKNGYELGALYAGELQHPGFKPLGRLSIKNAIKQQYRRMNLSIPDFIK